VRIRLGKRAYKFVDADAVYAIRLLIRSKMWYAMPAVEMGLKIGAIGDLPMGSLLSGLSSN
jgi:hypothetical protein